MTGETIYEKLTFLTDARNGLQKSIEGSDIGQTYSESVQEFCDFLGEIRQSGDIEAMLKAERALMTKDIENALSREPHIIEEMQRIERAERQLLKGLKCYEHLTVDSEAYQASEEYYSKNAPDGYPHDSCREFLGSQIARMRDDLKHPYNKEEADIIEARKANLEEVKKLYKDLQKELLPEPLRGVEAIKHYQAEAEKYLTRQNDRKIGMEQYRAEKAAAKQAKQSKAAQETERHSGREHSPQKGRNKDEDRGR